MVIKRRQKARRVKRIQRIKGENKRKESNARGKDKTEEENKMLVKKRKHKFTFLISLQC